jgi:uncharacterized cupin superfamily protein
MPLFPRAAQAYDTRMNDRLRIIALDRLQTGESANPSPEKILAGIPRTRVSNQYADGTQQFFCGMWTSTSGKWRIRYTEHEFCVITEGRVRIESTGGDKYEFRSGDAFVVPAGFEGTWEVVEPCKKWYAIFESSAG